MPWENAAHALARSITADTPEWRTAVARTPRHEFVPNWWARGERRTPRPDDATTWRWVHGGVNTHGWYASVYADQPLVVRVGADHADYGRALQRGLDVRALDSPGATDDAGNIVVRGVATCTATAPSVLLRLFSAARIEEGKNVLEIGTGTGYGTAVLAARLGDRHVSSIDHDPDLLARARERLAARGHQPATHLGDATRDVPGGGYAAIVSTVPVNPIPAAWLAALADHGRLVTPVAGTRLFLIATKRPDGTATGTVRFMTVENRGGRAGDRRFVAFTDAPVDIETASPPDLAASHAAYRYAEAVSADAEHVSISETPAQPIAEDPHLFSALGLAIPGVEVHHHRPAHPADSAGTGAVTCLIHPDGSWARAVNTPHGTEVHQHGPRRLWTLFGHVAAQLAQTGGTAHGAAAHIDTNGILRLDEFRPAPPEPVPVS